MKRTTLYCLLFLGAALTGNAEAVYKCTTAKGVVYQDRPCQEGTETDVRIVVPTGEIAPKNTGATDEGAQSASARTARPFGAPKAARAAADSPAAATMPADRNAGAKTAKTTDARAGDKSGVPMTAEQAQKAEPTAKYYTTDAAAPGFDVPQQMTCESPSGEKRTFFLTNGKLTSI